tara:strand:- start:1310 stop:2986 length:1677 start_codon:yes stop_codon:yes gene_type:complete
MKSYSDLKEDLEQKGGVILGLSFSHHDGSACLVKNGKILCAIELERLAKIKKLCFGNDDQSLGYFGEEYNRKVKLCIDYLLESTNLIWDDVTFIAIAKDPDSFELDYGGPKVVDLSDKWFDEKQSFIMPDCFLNRNTEVGIVSDKDIVDKILGCFSPKPILITHHHLAHHAAAFYTSPFESSIGFSLDCSSGCSELSYINSLITVGNENMLEMVATPYLLTGVDYQRMVEVLGIGSGLHKAGTLMGLSSYGTPDPNLDLKPFLDYKFKNYDEDFVKDNFKKASDIASTAQKHLETVILQIINELPTNSDNLCLSGGTFYNCPTNSRILKETRFKNIHHFPSCGDSGTAIGAALYVSHHVFGVDRKSFKPHEIFYLGKDYKLEKEIDYKYIAKRISEGAIVAWMNGRSEFGPRALGNRSLLADPRDQHNRDRLNHVIKKREWYRPFAPIVLEERYKDWFDFDVPSPFMLFTAQVKQPKEVPAIVHVDGSSRFQTITEESNIHMYKLIKEFENITGIPMLINTSLNGTGQPILETPEDGEEFFNNNSVDIAVIHGEILEK